MLKSLYSKLAIVLLGLFCVTGILFIILTIFYTELYQNEINQKLNMKLAENIVAEKLLMKDNRINENALKETFHMLMVVNPSIELYLLDPQGKILAYSAPPEKVKLDKVDLSPLQNWFSKNRVLPVMGEDPRHPNQKKAITVARIPKEGPLEGYLYIILGGDIYDSVMQKIKGSHILQVSFWTISAVVAFAIISGFLVFAFLTRRLAKLARAMDEFKENKTVPLRKPSGQKDHFLEDEIDRLDHAFTKMAEHIQNQMKEIQHSDNLRRELVANISHDLRTPIATLQGYVETLLLKEQSLKADERKIYLVTAHKHCQQLGALVENLFELAKLDAGGTQPLYEPFNISDLIQDVAQKFQLTAENKKIKITIDLEDNLPLANADIRLIERVMENLIENALQHTPAEGQIKLTLAFLEPDITVQVSDTGRGIPESELSNIFDRFYRVDKSRKTHASHSGLGLAITKRILELHDRSITVSSTIDQGTTFTFQVPAYTP
jgi:two-component system, OmpR family, sensor kinase